MIEESLFVYLWENCISWHPISYFYVQEASNIEVLKDCNGEWMEETFLDVRSLWSYQKHKQRVLAY